MPIRATVSSVLTAASGPEVLAVEDVTLATTVVSKEDVKGRETASTGNAEASDGLVSA